MRKWPDDYINKVICGDCIEVMKGIPPHEPIIIITDPPYGIGLEYSEAYEDSLLNAKDNATGLMFAADRLDVGCMAITCGVLNISLYPRPTWILCWSYAPSTNKRACWGFGQWQPVLVFGKDPYLKAGLGARPDMISDMRPPDKRGNSHPCPKPLTFMRKLINRCSVNPGDIILDPFLGSGTTAVAAKQLGRRYIGIEIEPKYCKIAEQRLAQEELF